jgi:hypothetical protein
MYQNKNFKSFTPRKPVKTFRDLDIYQKTLECSVIVMKDIVPVLRSFGQEEKGKGLKKIASTGRQHRDGDEKYLFLEGVTNCAMSVPLFIAESHSIRFGNFTMGLSLLEKAMSDCNKMIVYLEHIKGIYGSKVDCELIDDLISRYSESRTKSFHLELSWKKFRTATGAESPDGKIKNFKY